MNHAGISGVISFQLLGVYYNTHFIRIYPQE